MNSSAAALAQVWPSPHTVAADAELSEIHTLTPATLTDRFDRALLYATHIHGGQLRKGTGVPYQRASHGGRRHGARI